MSLNGIKLHFLTSYAKPPIPSKNYFMCFKEMTGSLKECLYNVQPTLPVMESRKFITLKCRSPTHAGNCFN